MLEQYKNRTPEIGEDCLDPGLKLERIRLKAEALQEHTTTQKEAHDE